jgi:hypothetical protein
MPDVERQKLREAGARDAALGKRSQAILKGKLGPVLRRWVNADVRPIARLLREAAEAYLAGDLAGVARLLDSPIHELASRERPLKPLLAWCLKGHSLGRGDDEEATYAEDLVLAFMACVLTRVAQDKCSLSVAMAGAADALRETVHGQFISNVQGASAMQAIRERHPERWRQKKSLARISAQLLSQARPEMQRLEAEAEERGDTLKIGSRQVLSIVDHTGKQRRLTLRTPEALDWEILALCFQDEQDGSTPESRNLWMGFAAMILQAAQVTGGWFEVSEKRVGRKGHTRTTKLLVLSEQAHEAIRHDATRWMELGFHTEPMIVKPEGGDYLTVKHRKVTGQRPPRGLRTEAEGTDAWAGACVLAETPWTVNPFALQALRETVEWEADAGAVLRVAEHRRLAAEEALYLPTVMDFRGRIYYRPTWVSPQSGDLGKSLLCFPLEGEAHGGKLVDPDAVYYALVMHFSNLYSGPAKLDKKPLLDRVAWFDLWQEAPTYEEADKPLTLKAHWELAASGQTDRIPIQLDGTCNGLQHLSALFRDEEAAPLVNLTASSFHVPPADIYHGVSRIVAERVASAGLAEEGKWLERFRVSKLTIDRKLTKGPVMVLPYGGTREAVRLAVKAAVMEQLGARYGGTSAEGTPWGAMEENGYAAFKHRDLFDHPGFNTDVGLLSGLVWESISPAIPKAMSAMATLQSIGSHIGEQGLAWQVGAGEDPLWVVQAKSKAARKQVKLRGFHLPDMVRRLTLMANTNEVDPKAHRSGIVANFIHSLDAAHLAATANRFRSEGGTCLGAVHDCLLVRPSEAALVGRCLREEFVRLYEDDPLSKPVKLIPVDGTEEKVYASWHELAEEAGVSFPERGTFDITEVRDSPWFFS